MPGVLVSDADIAHIRSVYPLLKVKPLTSQEEMFVYQHLKGMSLTAAAKYVGMTAERGRKLLDRDDVRTVIDFIREQFREELGITVESLTGMLMEAHAVAEDAQARIAAVRELGKLHGLYESDRLARQKQEVTLNLNGSQTPTNPKQVQNLDDEALLRLAGGEESLLPSREVEPGGDE